VGKWLRKVDLINENAPGESLPWANLRPFARELALIQINPNALRRLAATLDEGLGTTATRRVVFRPGGGSALR
jgi:hypothetical protein